MRTYVRKCIQASHLNVRLSSVGKGKQAKLVNWTVAEVTWDEEDPALVVDTGGVAAGRRLQMVPDFDTTYQPWAYLSRMLTSPATM